MKAVPNLLEHTSFVSDSSKVTTLASKSVTDLLSGGSLLAKPKNDGSRIVSREKMQTLLQQGKVVAPKGMPVTLIRNPNNPNQLVRLAVPMGGKLPPGIRIIRPDKLASVQIAKAAAAAKAGAGNVDTKKEAAAIVADVLARYNENQSGPPGTPQVRIKGKEEAKVLSKESDGKSIVKIINQVPGLDSSLPGLKDDVKPRLLKDIEMVREKEMAKGKEKEITGLVALEPKGLPKSESSKDLTDEKDPAQIQKPSEHRNEPILNIPDIEKSDITSKNERMARQESDKSRLALLAEDAKKAEGSHNRDQQQTKDKLVGRESSNKEAIKFGKEESKDKSHVSKDKINPHDPDISGSQMSWQGRDSMFSSSSNNTVPNNDNNEISNFTGAQRSGPSQFPMDNNSAGGMSNYSPNQFGGMNLQGDMMTSQSRGDLDRGTYSASGQFMSGNNRQGFISQSGSTVPMSQSGSQFGMTGTSTITTPVSARSDEMTMNNSNNFPIGSAGQNVDGQYGMRNQYGNTMRSMAPMGMSNNMDRMPNMMDRMPSNSMGNQMDMRQSDNLNNQTQTGNMGNQHQNMGSQYNIASQPSTNLGSQPSIGSQQDMRQNQYNVRRDSVDKPPINSPVSIGNQFNMATQPSMSQADMTNPQSMGSLRRPNNIDSQFTDMGRTSSAGSQFSMSAPSQPNSQQTLNVSNESSKRSNESHRERSSSSSSQQSTSESRRMPSSKETSPSKSSDSYKSNSASQQSERNRRISSTPKAESSRSVDWPSSGQSSMNPPKPADSGSSQSKELSHGLQQPDQPPSYPAFSSTVASPYMTGAAPSGYSMPPMYPSHMGHSSGYGMSHHGLTPWYSGLSPWSTPPSYPGMPPSDPYAKHMPGSTPSMSSYPGMSGYGGYHGNTPGVGGMTPKDLKESEKDKLSLPSRHGSKESLDMAGSAFDMQSSNPLSAMSAMSGMSSMGAGHSSGIGGPYHQGAPSMQSGSVSSYGAYSPYHHMSPLSHPMYPPPPPPGGSSYNYMSPYSSMSNPMMQHLPGSMPPLHPLSDMDPSRPPHMGP